MNYSRYFWLVCHPRCLLVRLNWRCRTSGLVWMIVLSTADWFILYSHSTGLLFSIVFIIVQFLFLFNLVLSLDLQPWFKDMPQNSMFLHLHGLHTWTIQLRIIFLDSLILRVAYWGEREKDALHLRNAFYQPQSSYLDFAMCLFNFS